MKRLFLLLSGLILAYCLNGHPWKPRHYVIIDTDGGADDMRALTMLMASPDVRVLAITISHGILKADSAYSRVRSLLHALHHEGIYTGINNPAMPVSPGNIIPGSLEIIGRILEFDNPGITFICLGSLATAANALSSISSFENEIKQIIWSGNLNVNHDFNFSTDLVSAGIIKNSGIPLIMTGGWKGEFYNQETREKISEVSGIYAEQINEFLRNSNRYEPAITAHDEMIPLFLHYPALFIDNNGCLVPDPGKRIEISDSLMRIISGLTVERNQVIKDFPEDPSFYFDDLKADVSRIIMTHGKDEWASGVLANELHRHLGTYAIIGVKMGIRAREYFNTGVDEFRAVSYAGSTPPVSCMNDGLQVSTGATPGHGLLTVMNSDTPHAIAEFTYLDRKIRVSLKPEIEDMISGELKKINFIYGLDSDIYWELVRKNTIRYWLDLDRHEIFTIEEL